MADEQKFLIDANLLVQVFEALAAQCEPVPNADWSDARIWQHAVENQLFIVTKDADFELRVMQQTRLRVVLLCIGNLKRRDLVKFLEANWPVVRQLCARTDKRLIKVFIDRIEAH